MSKEHSGKEFDETMALVSMNNLRYEAPESVCATASANRAQINFNPNAYSDCVGGEQPSLLFNVGSSYVNSMMSMIQFTMTLKVTNAPAQPGPEGTAKYFAFGNNTTRADGNRCFNSGGSVLNLISEVNHTSKSGELLYRELFKNQTQTTSRLYKIDKSRRGYLGLMGGAQSTNSSQGQDFKFPIFPINEPVTFQIPMCELSSFFSTCELLPPMLLSGSLLRLTLAPPSSAVVLYAADGITPAVNATVDSVSLKSMIAYLHQSELYDSVNSMLLSSANSIETNGLQYSYKTQFNTVFPPNSSTFNYDIQLSAAKISSLVLKFVPKNTWTGLIPADGGVGANKSDPVAAASICDLSNVSGATGDPGSLGFSIQVRLGSLVLPIFPVSSSVDMYQQTVNTLNPISYSGCDDPDALRTINKVQSGTISYADYNSVQSVGGATKKGLGTGATIFAFNFERSSAVNIGSLSTNNSRILSVEVQNMANADKMLVYSSVTYLQVANVSVDNVVINK
jgi:hypothetical protein